MPRINRVFAAWLVTGGLAMAAWVVGIEADLPALWIVTGLVLLAWGVAVASNYRGTADAMPRRYGIGPFRSEVSPALIRLIFGFFALWGAAVLATAVYRVA